MSHIATAKVVIKSLRDAKNAAKRLGGVLHENVKKYTWYEGKSSCDAMIEFPGARYSVGLIKQKDGTYSLNFDAWASGGLTPFIGHNGGKFSQAYAVEAAKRMARIRGYNVREVPRKDNQVELEVMVR